LTRRISVEEQRRIIDNWRRYVNKHRKIIDNQSRIIGRIRQMEMKCKAPELNFEEAEVKQWNQTIKEKLGFKGSALN